MAFPSSHASGVQSVPLDTFLGRHRTLGYAVNGIPLPTQPYLATAPIVQGSIIDTGKHFTLFFSSPDSQTLALLSSGTITTLQFLLADGRAPSAKVQITSSLSGSTLLVDVLVLSDASTATATLPFVLLQQDGSTRMTQVFGEIPEDIKDKPLLGLYDPVTHSAVAAQAGTTVTDNTNSVVYAPLASSGGGGGGGSDTQYTDGGVPPTHPIGNALEFTTGSAWVTASSASAGVGFPVQEVDGANATLGTKGNSAATDSTSSWTVVSLLKGILGKLLGSIAVTGTFWQATQPVSGTVTANAGTNLNTSLLALESGGNLASIKTNTSAFADTSATGTVTNDGDTVAISLPGGQATVLANILMGTLSGATLLFEASPDSGTTWVSVNGSQAGLSSVATSATAAGVWRVGVAGFTNFRIRLHPTTSGTSGTITLRVTQGVHNVVVVNASALGQNVMQNSQSVSIASDQSPIQMDDSAVQGPVNISAINGAGTPGPQLSATLNASADNTITFNTKVRRVLLHNQSAVNVPFEHDLAAVANSPYIAPGQLVALGVHTTVLHVFPSNALPINAANGLIVRGWA